MVLGTQYSDIDLIFSTFSADQLASLRNRVERMFSDAVYIRPKPLPAGVFLYVFLKNGLEFDIVLLPTRALQVRSSHWKILTDKTGQVLQRIAFLPAGGNGPADLPRHAGGVGV